MSLISIIIPTYNSAEYIQETLDSVLAQSYANFEIICVDDASSDSTVEIIGRYAKKDARIKFVQHPHNCGRPAYGRNTGLTHAQGEFVAFLDHDDLLEPLKLEKQLQSLKDQKVDFICSNIYLLNHATHKKDLCAWGKIVGNPKVGFLRRILQSNFVPPASTLIRKSVFDTVGVFDTNLVGVDDYDMWYRIARVFSASIINEPLASWRYANTASISSNEITMLQDEIHFYEKITHDPTLAKSWEYMYAAEGITRDNWLLANRYVVRGNYDKAHSHYILADKELWARRVLKFPQALRAILRLKKRFKPSFSPLVLDFTPND